MVRWMAAGVSGMLLLAGLAACERAVTAPASAAAAATLALDSGLAPGAAVFSVYSNGKFSWPGDYSFSAKADYADTSGAPLSGRYDVKVTLTGPWGGWLPFATNWSFDTTPYDSLRFAIKPTIAEQKLQVFFMLVGDKPVGVAVDPFKYGPAPVAGEWALYTIPLADIGVAKTTIYKFAIQDQTGLSNNVFYVDNVGFVAAH